jgi:hypothetical protein
MAPFVPAMKRSSAYAVFEKRRELMMWWEEEMDKVAAAKEIKAAKMQAIKEIVMRKLRTVSSLEEFSQARLLEVAKNEISKIVSASDEEARQDAPETLAQPPLNSYSFVCPHCMRKIAYKGRRGGKTVDCPHKSVFIKPSFGMLVNR